MILFVNGGTRTVFSIEENREHLGVLFAPGGGNSIERAIESGLPWAVDNGCFSGFDKLAYMKLIQKCEGRQRHRLRWITCPDVVADHQATLDLFDVWAMYLMRRNLPIAFVAQDGCTFNEVPWEYIQCLFIGGSTEWKLSQDVVKLIAIAKRNRMPVHVGRVNSRKRIRWCFDQGVASVDGTSMSRFSETYLPKFLAYVAGLKAQEVIPLTVQPRALLWPSSPKHRTPQVPHDAKIMTNE